MFRKIIHPLTSNDLVITLPEKYISKEVEIIAFEVERNPEFKIEESDHVEQVRKAFAVFDSMRVSTKGFKFNRDEANER